MHTLTMIDSYAWLGKRVNWIALRAHQGAIAVWSVIGVG